MRRNLDAEDKKDANGGRWNNKWKTATVVDCIPDPERLGWVRFLAAEWWDATKKAIYLFIVKKCWGHDKLINLKNEKINKEKIIGC